MESAMRKWVVTLLVALTLGLGSAGDLFAFRCGNDLVEKGDRKIEVLKKCGQPDSVDESEAIRRLPALRHDLPGRGLEKVWVEEWTYNFGPQRFLQIYRFENGVVVEMQFGGYGF
jgi:hypothetical protein